MNRRHPLPSGRRVSLASPAQHRGRVVPMHSEACWWPMASLTSFPRPSGGTTPDASFPPHTVISAQESSERGRAPQGNTKWPSGMQKGQHFFPVICLLLFFGNFYLVYVSKHFPSYPFTTLPSKYTFQKTYLFISLPCLKIFADPQCLIEQSWDSLSKYSRPFMIWHQCNFPISCSDSLGGALWSSLTIYYSLTLSCPSGHPCLCACFFIPKLSCLILCYLNLFFNSPVKWSPLWSFSWLYS